MNLIVFSPVHEYSAIGGVTKEVLFELSIRGDHNIVLVNTGLEKSREATFRDIEILESNSPFVSEYLSQGYVPIYQIGNSYDNHAGVFKWIFKYKGIVVFHDRYLGDLYRGYLNAGNLGMLDEVYGENAEEEFASMSQDGLLDENLISRYSLLEWITPAASSCLTHDTDTHDFLREYSPSSVIQTNLVLNKKIKVHESADILNPEPIINLVTFGDINQNKLVDRVIEAISLITNEIRETIRYSIVGSINPGYRQKLQDFADKHKVTVNIAGKVSDAELNRFLESSDLVLCLRDPIIESSSCSLIEAMFYGKKIIVLRKGHYMRHPDSVLIKVDPDRIVSDLVREISFFASNKNVIKHHAHVSKYAQDTFSPSKYADAISRAHDSHFQYLVAERGISNLIARVEPLREAFSGSNLNFLTFNL
jgi:hypothetical protein